LFIQTQVTRDRAQKPAVKHAARQVLPALILESFEEFGNNAGGLRNFVERYAAHLAFATQMLAERALIRCGAAKKCGQRRKFRPAGTIGRRRTPVNRGAATLACPDEERVCALLTPHPAWIRPAASKPATPLVAQAFSLCAFPPRSPA